MEKLLKNILKLAAVALTAPATLEVASGVYPDHPIYRLMISAAALLLVEGALLLGWYQLDTDHKATTAQRWLYAAVAVVAYIVLWIVAIAHHEGGAVWFRATLGVLLSYSVVQSGVLATVKINREIDRDVSRAGPVQRHRRKLAIADAKDAASTEFVLLRDRRSLALIVEQEQLKAEKDRALRGVALQHKRELRELAEEFSDVETAAPSGRQNPKRGKFPYDLRRTNERRRVEKSERIGRIRQHAADNPEMGPTALAQWARSEFGIAGSTAWEDLKALQPDRSNGYRSTGHE